MCFASFDAEYFATIMYNLIIIKYNFNFILFFNCAGMIQIPYDFLYFLQHIIY